MRAGTAVGMGLMLGATVVWAGSLFLGRPAADYPAPAVPGGAMPHASSAPAALRPHAAVAFAQPIAPPDMRTGPGGVQYWSDPSIDPEVLARAYAPPRSLPPEARPHAATIEPSKSAQHEMERDGIVAY